MESTYTHTRTHAHEFWMNDSTQNFTIKTTFGWMMVDLCTVHNIYFTWDYGTWNAHTRSYILWMLGWGAYRPRPFLNIFVQCARLTQTQAHTHTHTQIESDIVFSKAKDQHLSIQFRKPTSRLSEKCLGLVCWLQFVVRVFIVFCGFSFNIVIYLIAHETIGVIINILTAL